MCTDEIDRVNVSFDIVGDGLNPEEVTRLLETEPTHAHRRGDRAPTKSDHVIHYHTGVWLVDSRLSRVTDADAHIEDLLARMPRLDACVPEFLASGLRCSIRVAVFYSGDCLGWGLSPKTMRRLGEMGLELDLLAYGEPDEDEEEGEGNCESCQ